LLINVRNMREMFANRNVNAKHFDLDLSSWNVSNVTHMGEMFKHSQFNGDISKWDISKVVDIDDLTLSILRKQKINKCHS